jgi:Zn-dependent protease with chaperone function
MKADITVDKTYDHPIERVWAALTSAEALSAWLMPNDFQPTVGHEFTFRTDPAPGFDGTVHWVRPGDFYHESGWAGADALLRLDRPPTAIFAASDQMAFGVYEAVRRRGLRVPDDVSVVGFDDLPESRWASPPLTTVRQPLTEMGLLAARTVLRLARGEAIETGWSSRPRSSCGRVRSQPDPVAPLASTVDSEVVKRFDRRLARRAARDDETLIAELVAAGRTPPRPGWHPARVVVVAAAVLVQIVSVGSLALGAWLCVRHFPSYTLLPGVVLLAFGAVLLPRPPGLPRYTTRLRRRDAPELFAFVDRVAAQVGVPAPGLIVVDDRFAADGATTGVLRRRYLRLGAPLFAVLDAPQRAAVVAHQLAHFDSGDPLRGGPAAAVDRSMTALVTLFEPRPDTALRAMQDPQLVRASLATGGFGRMGGGAVADVWYAEILVRPVMAVLQWLSVLVRLAVVSLARSDVHRAEYRADAVAAEVAGSAAALEAVSMLALGEQMLTVLRRHVRTGRSDRPDPAAWRALARSVLEHDVAQPLPDASPFADHPPLAYRLRLLRSLPEHPAPPQDDGGDGVDADLATEFRRVARDLRYG